MNNKHVLINVYGKRITEYVFDCLAKFNRGIDYLILRAIGGNIAKGVEIAQILNNELDIKINNSKVGSLLIGDTNVSYIDITLKSEEKFKSFSNSKFSFPPNSFIDYPVYNLLLDWWLFKHKQLKLYTYNNILLVTIFEENGVMKCIKEKITDEKIFYDVKNALYRAGFLLPANWIEIAQKISEFDDVIFGVDTNVLYNCTITEHLLPSLSFIDPKEYVHTPNWILFVIPSAVMHELEESANIRDNGFLQFEGRMGYRVLYRR